MHTTQARSSALRRVRTPEELRKLLVRLGPGFVRLGHCLTLRPDLIREDVFSALLLMADTGPPVQPDAARQIIAGTLGAAGGELLDPVSTQAVQAGAFSQVLVARLADGSEVAVKIQRPGVEDLLPRERGIARVAAAVSAADAPLDRDSIADIDEWLRTDVDFARELQNLSTLHALGGASAAFAVARPYPQWSGAAVVSSAFLPGTSVATVLQLVRANQLGRLRSLAIDPAQIGDALLRTVFEQLFRLEVYQPDVHPRNLLVLADNRIGYADVAHVRRIEPDFRKGLQRHLAAIVSGDSRPVLESLVELSIAGEQSDAGQLRLVFDRDLHGRVSSSGAPPESDAARYLLAGLRAARRTGYRVPDGIAMALRTLVVAERIAAELGSRATLSSAGDALLTSVQVTALLDLLSPSQIKPAVLDALTLASDGPRGVRRLLADFVDGRLVLRVRTSESPEDAKLANARARLISIAVASVGVAFLASAAKGQMLFGIVPAPWIVWIVLAAIWIRLIAGLRELK